MLDGTGCTRWQEGCEEEVVSRRDDNHIVVFGVEFLEEGYSTPSSTFAEPVREAHSKPIEVLPRITRFFLVGSGSNWSSGCRSS